MEIRSFDEIEKNGPINIPIANLQLRRIECRGFVKQASTGIQEMKNSFRKDPKDIISIERPPYVYFLALEISMQKRGSDKVARYLVNHLGTALGKVDFPSYQKYSDLNDSELGEEGREFFNGMSGIDNETVRIRDASRLNRVKLECELGFLGDENLNNECFLDLLEKMETAETLSLSEIGLLAKALDIKHKSRKHLNNT